MEVTLKAAYIALQIGPFVALIFALPYTIYGYVRDKTVDVWKCTYLYSFCLYFICAYFVTWLPLPTAETFAKLKPLFFVFSLFFRRIPRWSALCGTFAIAIGGDNRGVVDRKHRKEHHSHAR